MKNILLAKWLLLTIFILFPFSTATYAKTPINFLYIHGSDQGSVEEFDEWINRMHPDMKKNLSNNALFQERELKDAYIKDEAQMLYWANKTQNCRNAVAKGLEISKLNSSFLSNSIRSFIAYMLHDVIWLQKYSNMKPLLDELNQTVIANSKKGEGTVLVGYSAGTLITYQYLLNKAKFLNLEHFLHKHQKELNISDKYIQYATAFANESTCIDALIDSKIAFMNADGGLMPNPDLKTRIENIKKLKTQTKLSCIPDNAVIGIINFGSPVLVFNSDIIEEKSQTQYFTAKLISNMIEAGRFFLTVNYKKDPIAIPVGNINFAQIQNKNPKIKNGNGFYYNTLINGGSNVIAAHLKYWDNTNSYTKAVAKSYEKGYKLFYGIDQ